MNRARHVTTAELRRRYGRIRWKALRRAIVERDGWRCTACGRAAGRLEVHHVKSVFDGGAMYDPSNLRTLCRDCHLEQHRDTHARLRRATMRPDRLAWAEFVQARLDRLGLDNGA